MSSDDAASAPGLPRSQGARWVPPNPAAEMRARIRAEVQARVDRPPRTLVGRLLRFALEGWTAALFALVALSGALGTVQTLRAGAYRATAVAGAVACAGALLARSVLRRIRADRLLSYGLLMGRMPRPAGPVAPRPWWRRVLAAFGWAVLVQCVTILLLPRIVPVPWNTGVPMVLTIAVLFSYHPAWWAPRWRRATLVHLGALVGLGLLVVALQYRLGWWR